MMPLLIDMGTMCRGLFNYTSYEPHVEHIAQHASANWTSKDTAKSKSDGMHHQIRHVKDGLCISPANCRGYNQLLPEQQKAELPPPTYSPYGHIYIQQLSHVSHWCVSSSRINRDTPSQTLLESLRTLTPLSVNYMLQTRSIYQSLR